MSSVLAQVPQKINYQGYLVSASDVPITNPSLLIAFKIYDVPSGGSALFTETQTVPVSNGLFNAVLGTNTALTLPFNVQYYLGVTVGADVEMAPRQALVSTPYALRSAYSSDTATLGGFQASDFMRFGASLPALQISGTLSTSQLADGAVTAAKLASNGCANGQVMQYNGSTWVCTSPTVAASQITGTISAASLPSTVVLLDGTGKITTSALPTSVPLLDGVGKLPVSALPSIPALQITGTLSTSQIADGAVTAAKLAGNGCTNGQFLQYSGSAWSCTSVTGVTAATAPLQLSAGTLSITSGSFVENTTSAQSANFNVTGNGVIGGSLTVSGTISGRQPNAASEPAAAAAQNAGQVYFNTVTNQLYYSTGSAWQPVQSGKTYRWAVWSTYSQGINWFANNDAAMFGGIPPYSWTDGSAVAASMSSDKAVLGALFNNKKTVTANSVVWAEEWYSFSSTNGRMAAALFRVRNTTAAAINWTPSFWYTAHGPWGEYASVTLNGVNSWSSNGASCGATCQTSTVLSVPAGRISTVIVVSASGPLNATRSVYLAFKDGSLTLPAGLEFVDDLDTSSGSAWLQ